MFEHDRTAGPAAESASLDPDPLEVFDEPRLDRGHPRRDARTQRGRGSLPRHLPLTRRQGVVATTAFLATALVGGLLAWNGAGPAAEPSRPQGSDSAAGSHDPGGSGSPDASPSTGPGPTFEPIPGSSASPTARLTARGAVGAVVPLDARFRLESIDGTPAADLARSLEVAPAVELAVAAQAGGDAVLQKP
jgi:hypothetical protein